jgi:hypothetical protein
VLPRITNHITRLWGHRKNVADDSNPGQMKSVEVSEVKITEQTLANLKEAVNRAEERIAACRKRFGQEALEDMDRRYAERKNPLSKEEQEALSKALPRLQLWPSNRQGEHQLKIFAFEVNNMDPVTEPSKPVLDATKKSVENNLPDERKGGFDGLGSLFG